MRLFFLILLCMGQSSNAADEGCEKYVSANPLEVLMRTIQQGDLDLRSHYRLRMQTQRLLPRQVGRVQQLERIDPWRARLILIEISATGDWINFDFSLEGTGRQMLQVLGHLNDSATVASLALTNLKWSVLGGGETQTDAPQTPLETLLASPMEILNLPFPIKMILAHARPAIHFVGDLVVRTDAQILKLHRIGPGKMDLIQGALEEIGLSLGMDIPQWPAMRELALQRIARQSARLEHLVQTSIRDFGLSRRVTNALAREGIATVGDLISKSKPEIGRIYDLGTLGLDEIDSKLAAYELKLREIPISK